MIPNLISNIIIFILGFALYYCILVYHEEKQHDGDKRKQ